MTQTWPWLALIGLGVVMLASLSQRTAVARLGYRSEEALYGLRVRLFEHLQGAPKLFMEGRSGESIAAHSLARLLTAEPKFSGSPKPVPVTATR